MRAEVTQVANATVWDDLCNTDLLFRLPSIWKNATLLSSSEVLSLAQQLESVKVCLMTELLNHPQMNCSQSTSTLLFIVVHYCSLLLVRFHWDLSR